MGLLHGTGSMRGAVGAIALAAASAIGAAPAVAASSPDGPGCDSGLPAVVHHADGRAADLPPRAAPPVVCAHDTGYETSETNIAASNSGALFFSPAHTENSLGRSFDGGGSWDLTYPPKMQYTSLWNTVDPVVTVDRRTGRLFWLRATGELRTAPVLVDESPFGNQAATALAYAHGFQVYSTDDDGRDWTTADYQREATGDWEKVFVGPAPPASSGQPQPSGYPGIVYVCANAPLEVSGPGRDCYRSLDGGATFSLAGYVFPSASAPSDFCPALAGNTGVVDSEGTTYQPQSCSNGSYLAVSNDEGATYSWLPIAGAPSSDGLSGAVQLAIDAGDNLYALWAADDGLELAISRDRGQTWSDPIGIAAPGLKTFALPALTAGGTGQVGISYYASSEEGEEAFTAYLTETPDALVPDPLLYSAPLNDPEHPIFTDYEFDASPRADYIGATYDPSGTLWAGVAKQLGEPDPDTKEVATTGLVGHLVFHDRVGLPSSGRCADRRKFRFRLHHARHARVVRVKVFVNGKLKLRRHGHNLRRVTLKRLPKRRFVVKIVAIQNTGSSLTSTRTYRGCRKSRPRTRAHHRRRRHR